MKVIEWLEINLKDFHENKNVELLKEKYTIAKRYDEEQAKKPMALIHNRILNKVQIEKLEITLIKEALGVSDE